MANKRVHIINANYFRLQSIFVEHNVVFVEYNFFSAESEVQ